MKRILLTTCLAVIAAASASAALAGPVTLRANPVDADGRVTLGDVFEDAGPAGHVVIANRTGPTIVFEAGQLQALALRAGLQWRNPQGLRRVVVREGAAVLTPAMATAPATSAMRVPASTSVPSPAVAGATVSVLTYARNLAAGDVVHPEDVVWTTVQAHLAASGGPSDADQVIGLSARRALRAGTPVGARDLASPQVIARNDMVEVAFISGGVKLTVTGRATKNAAIGEALPVLNLSSNRTIDAVATGPGKAVTGPSAQMARSNLNTFAAR